MPDTALRPSLGEAALNVEARLTELTGQIPEWLDARAIEDAYPRGRFFTGGWRVRIQFTDGVVRRFDTLLTSGFPSAPVRTALVDHPPPMTWPHVEGDGVLCLLPSMAECDPDDPPAVAENLFGRSVRLVEELLEGTIVERDFREEFLTYWAYQQHEDGSHLFSLLRPEPPSRVVRVWRGEGLQVVGEDASTLGQWLCRRYGADVNTRTRPGAFIWLDTPLLPAEYPETAADLRGLAVEAGRDASEALGEAAARVPISLVAIIGAMGRVGPGLIAVEAFRPGRSGSPGSGGADPLTRGFRPGRVSKRVALSRYFGTLPVIRSSVQRADPGWVHGRNRDSRTPRLLESTVVVIGCGSVGAPVASLLCQAGAGRVILVDYDVLSWPNVGRHPLGAPAVGRNKAEALAERLQPDFPHLRIEARTSDLHGLLQRDKEILERADLIVSATGNWAAENALNRWHVVGGRRIPIVYGWTEAHACAGHAVAIGREGGCFQCHIGRTGKPSFKVVEWPDGGTQSQEEPACGEHYSPYGPVELSYVTAMVADVALECLLTAPRRSFSRVFVASRDRIEELGGRWSEEWIAEQASERGGPGVRTVDRPWNRRSCPACEAQAGKSAGDDFKSADGA